MEIARGYCCFCFTVFDSVVVVFCAAASGLVGSAGVTSVLFEVVVFDSDSVGAGGGGGVAACWQPVNINPKAIRGSATKHLYEFVIRVGSYLNETVSVTLHAGLWPSTATSVKASLQQGTEYSKRHSRNDFV